MAQIYLWGTGRGFPLYSLMGQKLIQQQDRLNICGWRTQWQSSTAQLWNWHLYQVCLVLVWAGADQMKCVMRHNGQQRWQPCCYQWQSERRHKSMTCFGGKLQSDTPYGDCKVNGDNLQVCEACGQIWETSIWTRNPGFSVEQALRWRCHHWALTKWVPPRFTQASFHYYGNMLSIVWQLAFDRPDFWDQGPAKAMMDFHSEWLLHILLNALTQQRCPLRNIVAAVCMSSLPVCVSWMSVAGCDYWLGSACS
jgi:hypothetical protein